MSILRKLSIFAVLLTLVAAFAAPVAAQDGEIAVTLERGVCFGTCPAYSITIYTDGTVVYKGDRFVAAEGTRTLTLEPEVVAKLVAEIANLGYFEWADEYTEMTVTDLPTIITSVTLNGETKQITRYAGDSSAPLALPYIETWIDLVTTSAQWTGVSPQFAQISMFNTPVMTLERTACFGTCPVYGVAVHADGTVVYLGMDHVDQLGVRVAQVEPDQVEFLAMQTASAGYFGWQDEYLNQLVTDQPYVYTSLTWDDQFKAINRYDGDPNAPVGLLRFEEAIDRLVNSEQWVAG